MTKTGHIILWGWINALLTILVLNALGILVNGSFDATTSFMSVILAIIAYYAGCFIAEDSYGK